MLDKLIAINILRRTLTVQYKLVKHFAYEYFGVTKYVIKIVCELDSVI